MLFCGCSILSANPESYRSGNGKAVAPIPRHLQGPHITLFGPADGVKMCSYAMNAVDKKTLGEPAIVEEIISRGVAQVFPLL